jgi:hypothetical protein
MYGAEAIACRRCRGTRKDGQLCRAWAVWDDPRQLCMAHAGRHFRGERPYRHAIGADPPAQYTPCCCSAYAWPHRPGGGVCEWPNQQPTWSCTTPAGTHDWPRLRRPNWYPSRRQRWEGRRR